MSKSSSAAPRRSLCSEAKRYSFAAAVPLFHNLFLQTIFLSLAIWIRNSLSFDDNIHGELDYSLTLRGNFFKFVPALKKRNVEQSACNAPIS